MKIKNQILKKLGLGPKASSENNSSNTSADHKPAGLVDNLEPGTLNLEPSGQRTRTGKVARLPLDARITVNTMLDDAQEYTAIIDKLTELGHPGFITQNISRWKQGGYQTWVRDRQQSELAQIHADSALQLIRETKDATQLCEANAVLLASQTWRALLQFQSCPAEELIGERASKFVQFAKASTAQFAERTRRDLANSKIQSSPASRARADKPLTLPDRNRLHKLVVDIVDESIGITLPPDTASNEVQPAPSVTSVPLVPSVASVPSPSEEHTSAPVETPSPLENPAPSVVESSEVPTEEIPPSGSLSRTATEENSTSQTSVAPEPETSSSESAAPLLQSTTPLCPDDRVNRKSEIENSARDTATQGSAPSPRGEGRGEGGRDLPISPLAPKPPAKKQPRNHVPLFDRHGGLIAWFPREGPGSTPPFEPVYGFENRHGQTICWFCPKNPYDGEPPTHWKLAIIDSDGRIIGWTPHHVQPSETAIPLRPRACINYTAAWYQDTSKPNHIDCRYGALVG
jgi:hypothetical protein